MSQVSSMHYRINSGARCASNEYNNNMLSHICVRWTIRHYEDNSLISIMYTASKCAGKFDVYGTKFR